MGDKEFVFPFDPAAVFGIEGSSVAEPHRINNCGTTLVDVAGVPGNFTSLDTSWYLELLAADFAARVTAFFSVIVFVDNIVSLFVHAGVATCITVKSK